VGQSGPPDPEIEKLEHTLSPLAHSGAPLVLPTDTAARAPGARAERSPGPRERAALPRNIRWLGLPAPAWAALAASVIAIAGPGLWAYENGVGAAWAVARLEGTRRIAPRASRIVTDRRGRSAETNAPEHCVGGLAGQDVHCIAILSSRIDVQCKRSIEEHGSLLAVITATPRRFAVETPGATAVDLGCAYTLEVDRSGSALVTVLVGWVSFENHGRESFIPAGARCATRPGHGPGTPYFTDASAAFKNALVGVDLLPEGATDQRAALTTLLANARREDALTLWHLIQRGGVDARGEVYERFAALVPPPAGVTRTGVLAGDRVMLDRWWEALGYGDTAWWRLWKRDWPNPG
jgi:hypothetical protein